MSEMDTGTGHPGGRSAAPLDAERVGVLEAVFRASPNFLHVLRGADFVFEFANEAYYRLVGHRDLIGRPAFEALPEAAGNGFPERIARVMAMREPFEGRELPVMLARVPGAAPEERLIDLVYIPLIEPDGTCTRVLGHGTDVTDHVRARRESEVALAAERFELAQANRQLREQQELLERTNAELEENAAELEMQIEAAELERARASDILERMADAYFALDADFHLVGVNAAMERGTGHTRDQLLGRLMWDVFPGTRGNVFERHYRAAIQEGIESHFTHEYQDGRLRIVTEVDVYPAPGGGAAVFWRDISERTHAEAERARLVAELENERERLRAVILDTPAPMALVVGPELRFALVNEAYSRVSGGGRDVTGLTPREAFPELAGSGLHELFDHVYTTGEAWLGSETPVRYDRDGTGVEDTWFDLRYQPVRDAEGRMIGVLNFAVDVTDQVRARRETERLLAASEAARADAEQARAEAEREGERATAAQREAEAANAAKAQFLANMSHELRTPLNAIAGYVQLLDMGLHGPVTGDQRVALARVQAAQMHLLALINDILNFAKLESGRVEYDVCPVDVADAVSDVVPLIEPQLRAKGLAFDVRLPDGPCLVWADREKLGQVLVNLLSNAVKFTDSPHPATGAPGRVTVEVATRHDGDADDVFVLVRDTGRGIPREKQEAIFEPFVQVRSRAQSVYAQATEGTGLGLAISRDLARGMGGDLRVRSEPGEGATFTVALRRVASPADFAA